MAELPYAAARAGRLRASAALVWSGRFAVIYLALAGWFLVRIVSTHDPRTGFSSLLVVGEKLAGVRLARLRDLPIHLYGNSGGYDGQFYAQIAVAGNPFDPELRTALDAPEYRARRILLPLLAHLVGLGRPAWVLVAYELSNLACWMVLAWLLARWWFPPNSLNNLIRWVSTTFAVGMLVSVARSLTDGPALLVVAIGIRSIERNRRWLGAGILAAAGLVRETSVLAAAALLPGGRADRATWRRALLMAALAALPAIAWMGILIAHYGTVTDGGLVRPGAGFAREWSTALSTWRRDGFAAAAGEIFVLAGILVQLAFFLGRPRPGLAWWRVGAPFAILPLFLGVSMWDDTITSVPRILLPMTLAFNVIVPSTRRWLVLLLAGNLGVLAAPRALDIIPVTHSFAGGITYDLASGWYQRELSRAGRTWQWASGSAVVTVHNPSAADTTVNLDFELSSPTNRTVTVRAPRTQQTVPVVPYRSTHVRIESLRLPPGDTSVALETTEPPWPEPGPHGRQLSFAIVDLKIAR